MDSPPSSGNVIRPAIASQGDGRVFARLLDEAQEGWYRLALGSDAERLVAAAFTEPNHDLSFEFVTMVERNGLPVAMCSAYSGRVSAGEDPIPWNVEAVSSHVVVHGGGSAWRLLHPCPRRRP